MGQRSGRARPSNLPSEVTSFVGRRQELREVKRLLLVLDNCEHLLDGCAILAGTLIRSCPDLHVLATSRQALGVTGEVRMAVPPMSLPSSDGP